MGSYCAARQSATTYLTAIDVEIYGDTFSAHELPIVDLFSSHAPNIMKHAIKK